MKKTSKAKRITVLDLLRFAASLFIVWYHSGFTLRNNNPFFHFAGSFLFVEFFLMIMGYFTYRHFDYSKYQKCSLDKKYSNSIRYTLDKFAKYLPYVVISVLLTYLIQACSETFYNASDLLSFFQTLPTELLLLGSQTGERLVSLWFLSAAFIVFPVFCALCQTRKKNVLLVLSLLSCIVYYSNYCDFDYIGVAALFRCFFGLLLGVLVYYFANYISRIIRKRILPSFIEIISFVCFMVAIYPSDKNMLLNNSAICVFAILCLVVELSLLLSGKTIQSKIESKIFIFLGNISLQVFLFHLVIKDIIYLNYNYLPTYTKALITFGGTILLSIIVYFLVELFKQKVLLLEPKMAKK